MRNVTKEVFLNALICPTSGWLIRNPGADYVTERDLAERFRMEEGIEVHKRARAVYPVGFYVGERDGDRAVVRTRELIGDRDVNVIFEGAFAYGNYIARADILQRLGNSWHLLEVKSSVNDKPELVDDLSYTIMVCRKAGLPIIKASLLLISRDYRLGMPISDLFIEIDHTDDALSLADEFSELMEKIDNVTFGPMPKPDIIFACKDCERFSECSGSGIKHPIFEIPRLSVQKFDQLKGMGVFSVSGLPDGFSLTDNQRKVRSAVRTNAPVIEDNFEDFINSVSWPAYYLDFETVKTALPLYPDIAPHTQIPTQYSIHKCPYFGKVERHFEYLADPSRDCRRELALNLIENLEGSGSIVVYSGFEKTVIGGLIKLFPDLERDLSVLIGRIIDLKKIIENGIYHPDFHGSYSIKDVLPALVPEMSYRGLEIADGGSAIAAFAYMAMGKYSADEVANVKVNLLAYCGQDTLAMVKLHDRLRWYI